MRFNFPGSCNHFWSGVYPGDGIVEHECFLKPNHTEPHACGCGDTQPPEQETK